MKVSELIAILQDIQRNHPVDLPIATHANNHTSADTYGNTVRVCYLHHYSGPFIVIGNISKKNLNEPNWYVTRHADNGPAIPAEWGRP